MRYLLEGIQMVPIPEADDKRKEKSSYCQYIQQSFLFYSLIKIIPVAPTHYFLKHVTLIKTVHYYIPQCTYRS